MAYEIEAEISLGTATEIGFRLRTDGDQYTTVGYDAEAQELFATRMKAQTTEVAGSHASLVVHAQEVAAVIEKAALAE